MSAWIQFIGFCGVGLTGCYRVLFLVFFGVLQRGWLLRCFECISSVVAKRFLMCSECFSTLVARVLLKGCRVVLVHWLIGCCSEC